MTQENPVSPDVLIIDVVDPVGEIVNARCEAISDNRIIGRFGDNQRVSVAKGEFTCLPIVGDTFDVYVEGQMKNGMWGGSIDKIAPYALWRRLDNGMREETDFDVVVVAAEPNGLVCDLLSVAAFMPTREIGVSDSTAQQLIGQTMRARIIKISPQHDTVIISHRAAIAQALREAREESGIRSARPVSEDIFSVEALTVNGHEKRGAYVSSHLHLNVTYLLEADEGEALTVKPDENSGVRWFTLEESETAPSEAWFCARVYRKLNEKLRAGNLLSPAP